MTGAGRDFPGLQKIEQEDELETYRNKISGLEKQFLLLLMAMTLYSLQRYNNLPILSNFDVLCPKKLLLYSGVKL